MSPNGFEIDFVGKPFTAPAVFFPFISANNFIFERQSDLIYDIFNPLGVHYYTIYHLKMKIISGNLITTHAMLAYIGREIPKSLSSLPPSTCKRACRSGLYIFGPAQLKFWPKRPGPGQSTFQGWNFQPYCRFTSINENRCWKRGENGKQKCIARLPYIEENLNGQKFQGK